MAGTPTTQQQLDALNAAIAAGVVSVRQPDGAEIRYPSLSELIAARDVLAAEIRAQNGAPIYSEVAFRRPC